MFWRLLAVGGILVALGTAGVLFTGQQDTGDASAPRLALAVTDAQELRCTKGVSSWEIHADVLARRLGNTPLSEAQLAVAYVLPGKTTAVAPVQIVTRDGFASGVSSQADTVRFQPVVRTELPCEADAAELIAKVRVGGESLDARDQFLTGGIAMASPVVIGVVIVGLVGLVGVAVRR